MKPRDHIVKFFESLDKLLSQHYSMTLIGGSAMVLGYESERMTSDCDPWGRAADEILKKWNEAVLLSGVKIGIDTQAGVAQMPEGFEERLQEADLKLKNITIRFPESYDLALSKISRLQGADLDDIIWLHRSKKLSLKTLVERYLDEFRPIYIGQVRTLDFNLLDVIEELFGPDSRIDISRKISALQF